LGNSSLTITEKAMEQLISFADGDARAGLNGLEFVANYFKGKREKIEAEKLSQILKEHALRYDKKGEEHYNVIFCFL